jgi:hypothetical protein
VTISLMSEDYSAHYANLSFFGVSAGWQKYSGELVSSVTGGVTWAAGVWGGWGGAGRGSMGCRRGRGEQ